MKIKKIISKKALKDVKPCMDPWKWSTRLREAENQKRVKQFIYQQWVLIFGSQPPENVSLTLLRIKISYHLEYERNKANNKPMSDGFLKNYKAAMALNLQGFDESMRYILEMHIKNKELTPEEEEEMKIKKKKAVEKAKATKAENAKGEVKGPKKGETWASILQANYKAKLSDKKLAELMTKAMKNGHIYTEQEVVKARGFFNFGALSSKVKKPVKPLQKFE